MSLLNVANNSNVKWTWQAETLECFMLYLFLLEKHGQNVFDLYQSDAIGASTLKKLRSILVYVVVEVKKNASIQRIQRDGVKENAARLCLSTFVLVRCSTSNHGFPAQHKLEF